MRQRRDACCVRDYEIAHDANHRGVEESAREQRRDRGRTLAVRIRQPSVHRRQTDFRTVADQDQKERQRDERRVEPRRHLLQGLPGHVVGLSEDKRPAPVK